MSAMHLALIVEDEEPISSALVEILLAANCQSVVAANRDEATEALETNSFCIVLLDMKIKATSTSNLPHQVHGRSVLQSVRDRHQKHVGRHYWLPVLVVSGFAGEYDVAVDVLREGAHDVVPKPFKAHEVVSKIEAVLHACGRSTHELCVANTNSPTTPAATSASTSTVTSPAPTVSDGILIDIPSELVGRKARMLVNGKGMLLEPRLAEFLLRLLVGHLRGGQLRHKSELGAGDGSFRLPSELRNLVKGVLGTNVDVIRNDGRGSFGLASTVRIGACDTSALEKLGERQITQIARELRQLLDEKTAD